jgi:hypothetical protein
VRVIVLSKDRKIASSYLESLGLQFLSIDYFSPDELSPAGFRSRVLTTKAPKAIAVFGPLSDYVCALRGHRGPITWCIEGCEDQVVKKASADEAAFDRLRVAIFTATSFVYASKAFTVWAEDALSLGLSRNIGAKRAWAFSMAPVLISLGAGLGNVIQGLPLIKKISSFLNAPVDVFLKCQVPGVESLFADAPFINLVTSDEEALGLRRYKKAYLSASSGAVLPPVSADRCVAQRHLYQMMEECRSIHESEYCFRGIEKLFPEISYTTADSNKFFVRDLVGDDGRCLVSAKENHIGLFNGIKPGHWERRNWDSFPELASVLKTRGFEVCSFGFSEQYIAGTQDLTGTGIRDTIFNLAACETFISCDGGLLHLAEALGIPCVSLFGPTSVVKNGPITPSSRLVHLRLPCSPCQWTVDFETCDNNTCMTGMTVEHVIQQFDALRASLAAGNCREAYNCERFEICEFERRCERLPCRDAAFNDYTADSVRLLPKDMEFNERLIKAYLKNQDYVRAGQLIQRCLHLMPEEGRLRRLEAEMHLLLKEQGYDTVAVEVNW